MFYRFSVSFTYYGLSLGADSLSDNLYANCALMGLVELPGIVVCILTVDRLVWYIIMKYCDVVLCRYGRKISLVSSQLVIGITCICIGAIQWTSQCKLLLL